MTPFLVALIVVSAPAPKTDLGTEIIGSASGAVALVVQKGVKYSPDGAALATLVLKGKGSLEATALDDDGSLWVVRKGGRLGKRSPDGKETWLKIPGAGKTEAFAVRGGVVVWFGAMKGDEGFLVSTDGGVTFAERPSWPTGSFETVFTLESGGRIQIIAGWEASCGGGYQQRRYGKVTDEELAEVPWGLDVSVGYLPGANGWAYVASDCGDAMGICALSPTDETIAVLPISVPDVYATTLFEAHDKDTTWLVVNDALYGATGLEVKAIPGDLPKNTSQVAVVKGKPWLLAGGHVYSPGADAWALVAAFE